MTPILFYGVPEGCSFGSIVALEWLGIPYRLCRVQMPEVVSGETYRIVNPMGETPSLRTSSGAMLSESMAILNHLGALGIDKGLGFRQGTAEFDRANAMLGFLNTTFFNAYTPLWHLMEHETEAAEAEVLTAYGRGHIEKAHADLEAKLGDGPWLLGEGRTLADAYFYGIARWADFHHTPDRRAFPGLSRLVERLKADPAIRFAHAIEHEEPAQSAGGFQGHIGLEEAVGLIRVAA